MLLHSRPAASAVRVLAWLVAAVTSACTHDWTSVTRDAAGPNDASDVACAACDGGCVLLASDPTNCGACGVVCPPVENAIATCEEGLCGSRCATGFDRCGSRCLSTDANISYCGTTCFDCTTLAHVSSDLVTCIHGTCSLLNACESNWRDCDGVLSTGCEVDVSQPSNCGMCGHVCDPTAPNCVPLSMQGSFECQP